MNGQDIEDPAAPPEIDGAAALPMLAATLGGAIWVVIGAYAAHLPGSGSPPAFPAELAWDHYLLSAAVWGAGTAVAAVVLATRGRPGRRGALGGVLLCDLGVLLAVLWPVQVAFLAVRYAARARRRRPWQRLGAVAVGLLLMTGGCQWGSTADGGRELNTPRQVTAAELQGPWRNVTGRGTLELGTDGRFTAHQVPGTAEWGRTTPARVDAVGTWSLGTSFGNPVVVLTNSRPESSPGVASQTRLYVSAFGTSPALCASQDPDSACDRGFHR